MRTIIDHEVPKLKVDNDVISVVNCIFMKVGSHGDENFDEIITRKREELNEFGFLLWGYSGTLLNPTSISNHFKINQDSCTPHFLLMIETNSPFKNFPCKSTMFSIDSKTWYHLPKKLGTRGCDKALICKNLIRTDFTINISKYRIAIGPSKGKLLIDYLKYRTDKACTMYDPSIALNRKSNIRINWISEIVPPYAVYLRSDTKSQDMLFPPFTDLQLGILSEIAAIQNR